jgi:hypothetical protein
MKNKQLIWLVLGIVGIVVGLIFLFYRQPSKKTDWRPSYREISKNPYGTFVISELLKKYFPGKDFEVLGDSLRGALPRDYLKGNNYMFVGEALFLDSMDLQSLLHFVNNGNTAFIASRTIPQELMAYLYDEKNCDDYYWDDYSHFESKTVGLNFEHPQLEAPKDFNFRYISATGPAAYEWNYIGDYYFCDSDKSMIELGYMNDSLVNFARVAYGKGTFYLHTIPYAFSNIAMLDSTSLQYANRVFSYLAPGKIYWDEYSKTTESVGRRRNNPSRARSRESPLQYVLSQPPLAWAWYLMLTIALLYLVFRTKRKQRIIPVLEANINTSLAFVSTIGRLYFLQNNHKQLALQKMKLWLNFVRERYHLKGQETDEAFQQKLIAKSEVSENLVNRILQKYHEIANAHGIHDNALIDFHQLLDEFYRTCK